MASLDPNVHPEGIANTKTGNAWTASMHIFCAIVGAGVLALPNTFVSLGWIAGPILVVLFFVISMTTSFLLADIYQVDGIEFPRYHMAVRYILTRWESYGLSVCQMINMVLVAIAYTVSPATAMKRIAELACEYQGKDLDDCWDKTWKMTLIFGATQVPLSLMPNLESLWWISGIGAIMSICYATIALALGLKYGSAHKGTIGGYTKSPADKAFGIMNALGSIAFAYSFHVILLEIQDTIRQPPRASKTMKKATCCSISVVFFYYIVIAVGGYAALGNDAPSYIFAGYTQAPKWVMIMGNVCIIIHMLSAFQLYAQPVFETIESNIKYYVFKGKYAKHAKAAGIEGGNGSADDLASKVVDVDVAAPESKTSGSHDLSRLSAPVHDLSRLSAPVHNLERASAMYRASSGLAREDVEDNEESQLPFVLRFGLRTAYVIALVVIACCLPFFSDIAGLVGAVTFWPLSVYFPIQMWRKVYRPYGFTNWILIAINIGMFFVAVAGTIGSIRAIIESSKNYTVFGD